MLGNINYEIKLFENVYDDIKNSRYYCDRVRVNPQTDEPTVKLGTRPVLLCPRLDHDVH